MERLVDYFAVVGYDHSKQRGGLSCGKVLQRFPTKDWPDVHFIDGIELFCQPQGWRLSASPQQPTYFFSVLTQADANKQHCACLSFNEPIAIQPIKQADDEDLYDDDDMIYNNVDGCTQHHSIMYAPKCLVLISRFSYSEVFKNCLGIIYTVYIDNLEYEMEKLIGNLLACIEVPPFGSPLIRFSLGANDRQLFQPPVSPTVPVTGTSVHQLFDQLGIQSVITLFSAITTEHKILFHSKSYSRLHDACHALTSLMYPFHYCHTYIPLLPSSLLQVLDSPTPFVIGVHSSLRNEVEDLLDVITVDLDGGSLSVPEHLPRLDEHTTSQLVNHLCLVIRPQLCQADDAFISSQLKPSPPFLLDKEIRAIFVRLFAQLLQGYRTCLRIVRIHPKPFITFHKSSFLGQRNLVENEFVVRLLDCMFFNIFVRERGPPFRGSDLFDELYATMNETLKREAKNPDSVLDNIRNLAQQLLQNECQNPRENLVSKVPQPTEGAFTRIHHPLFPELKGEVIEEIIENERIQKEMSRRPSVPSGPKSRIIPVGAQISAMMNGEALVTNSARRLEVMKNCVNCIFESKISDARKTFPAVLRALKNKSARLALVQELSFHAAGKNAILDHEQFDLVVRLMNCALQQDSDYLDGSASGLRMNSFGDVNGVGYAILPLSMAFCRRLSPGVMQFAYTCLQDHPIWSNQGFWEDAFYQSTEKAITSLYSTPKGNEEVESNVGLELTPLDVAAEQIRLAPKLSEQKIKDLASNEEATVYSQAIHFAHQMVALKVPFDIGNHERIVRNSKIHNTGLEGSDSNSNNTGTGPGRESVREDFDNESGFEEGSNSRGYGTSSTEISANVIKFIGRFVDNVCTEGGVSEDHIKQLHQIIPGFVALQCETIDGVYKESRNVPPTTKPKIVTPDLIGGEDLTMQGLRAYLVPDGRDEVVGSSLTHTVGGQSYLSPGGGPILLPAEGAIFLTNYRVIFRGKPCDPFSSECTIVRSFPIATLTKEKRISLPSNYPTIDQYIKEGLQLRSSTCQLMQIAFDKEVTTDAIEMLRKLINKARAPATIFHLFAFTSQVAVSHQMKLLNLQKQKDKSSTLRGMAKKTLLKTAAKAGLPVKSKYNKRNKYFFPAGGGSSKTMAPLMRSQLSTIESIDERSLNDDVSVASDSSHIHSTTTLPPISANNNNPLPLPPVTHKEKNTRTLRKLTELSYVKDYERLGIGRRRELLMSSVSNLSPSVSKSSKMNLSADGFRITTVNMNYSICQSYPIYIVVPGNITDDSIRKLSRCYKDHRFPAITWRHPKNKALLLRGSSFIGKSVIGMFKGTVASSSSTSANSVTAQLSHESSASLEQDKFFKAVVNLTPSANGRKPSMIPGVGSSMSIPSLMFSGAGSMEHIHETVKDTKKQHLTAQFQKAINTFRSSGGKGAINSIGNSVGKQLQKLSNSHKANTEVDRLSMTSVASSSCASSSMQPNVANKSNGIKVSLYVFGEKAQIKNIKADQYPSCEFIPVDIHEVRQTKQSFKKMLRSCCPSSVPEPECGFLKQIEHSEWLNQLQTILQIATAIIDLIDFQRSSVMLCLEDSTDLVPQIASVAEICLDPYYRTFEGFRVLVEKEWLAFGHRFSHRSNHTEATMTSGFAPIFLQFLDIVHQIMNQFPLSFEFNQYYLKFIAYHYVSCRFRTFLMDSECEREEFGWLEEDVKRRADDDYDMDDGESQGSTNGTQSLNANSNQLNLIGTSLWDYAEKLWSKSSIFYNFNYIPTNYHSDDNEQSCVLRPFTNICNLKVWDYFLVEELNHGPSFDFEVVLMEKQRKEEIEATNEKNDCQQKNPKRRVVNAIYDAIEHSQENSFQLLLESIQNLEAEFATLPTQKWSAIWNKIEIPMFSTKNLGKIDSRLGSVSSQMLRRYCRSASNKRSPLDLLIGGKMLESMVPPTDASNFDVVDSQHKFEKNNFEPPVACDYCKYLVSGLMKSGLQCVDCGYNCHEQCSQFVPKVCRIVRSPVSPIDELRSPDSEGHMNGDQTPSDFSSDHISDHSNHQYYNHLLTINTPLAENRTHEGYLYKKGSLLKNWKQRWFVLDSSKHQLRYYDSQLDNHSKGFIDLTDVISVAVNSTNVASVFFDLKTVRRNYNFMADSSQAAQEWIEKIQACLQ